MAKKLISGNNFAKSSDFIFVEEVSLSDFNNMIDRENIFVIRKDKNYVCYLNRKISLKENNIIFCKTDYVDLLFKHISKIESLKNLKLITSQSDISVSKKLFFKKPECISTWYSTNAKYNNSNLVSIPLGLANQYSEKNLNQSHFQQLNKKSFKRKKIAKIYSNFNVNTRFLFRKQLLRFIRNHDSFIKAKNSLTLEEYKNNLIEHRFVLCPPGNGIDTHRIWESIYSNSFPIVFKKYYLDYFKFLPIIVVDNIKKLQNFDLNSKPSQFIKESVFIDWWIDLIKGNSIESNENVEIEVSIKDILFYLKINSYKLKLLKLLKIIKTIYIKFDRKLLRVSENL